MKKQHKLKKQRYIYDEREETKIKDYIYEIIKEQSNLLFFCLRYFYSSGYKSIDIEPVDIIYEVIAKILEGRRKVDLKSYKSFRNSFYFILKNTLNDFFNCDKNKFNGFKESFDSEDDEDNEYMGEFSDKTNIQEDYEQKEYAEKIREILKPFKEELEVFELLLKGYRRSEIAEIMKISPSDVTNIKKRIERRLASIED